MSKLDWGLPGQRLFEAGVDRVVLYPRLGPGVPWNGVVSIGESVSGGEAEALYFDGVKVRDVISYEDFQASLDAYSAPAQFAACDGSKQLSPGLFATQQPRQSFSLCYRTLIGNDLVSTEYGYKLHLVYNCKALPSNKTNQTISENASPGTRSWQINAVPPKTNLFRPTAHLVLDSTLIDPYLLSNVETLLYGRDAEDNLPAKLPHMPSIDELLAVLANPITALIEATV